MGWVKVDLAEIRHVNSYTMRGRDDDTSFSYKSWTFEGSNDDLNWTVLDSPQEQTNWGSGEVRVFDIPASAYRYFRWNITNNNGGVHSCAQELELIGY